MEILKRSSGMSGKRTYAVRGMWHVYLIVSNQWPQMRVVR